MHSKWQEAVLLNEYDVVDELTWAQRLGKPSVVLARPTSPHAWRFLYGGFEVLGHIVALQSIRH